MRVDLIPPILSSALLGWALCCPTVTAAQAAGWSEASPMSAPRMRPGIALLEDGRVLVIGRHGTGYVYLQSAELYDPVRDRWSSAEPEINNAAAIHGLWLVTRPVLLTGRVELLADVREQSVTNRYHRFGNLAAERLLPKLRSSL